MYDILTKLFRTSRKQFCLPRSEVPLVIIGDIHGRFDLLRTLLARLQQNQNAQTLRHIFVGDLIDRGSQSANVLDIVRANVMLEPERFICLMGNHERMMLDFLKDPEARGQRWFNAGGIETLVSFGIKLPLLGRMTGVEYRAAAEALHNALPEGMENWIGNLPLIWQQNDLIVTHAGAAPRVAIKEQSDHDLLWGHPDFLRKPRKDGLWVAHGHYTCSTATAEHGRISTDTAAWTSGRLSAALIDKNGVTFLVT